MRHTTWLATVALVLALVGAARAENTLVGNLDDDYGITVRIYRSDDGIVGVSIRDKGQGHFALLSTGQARELASMLESTWHKRNAYSEDALCGAVDGLDGRAIVTVMTGYPPNRVSLAVNDTDTGIAASFWSSPGAIRYLANTLRRAAR